MKNIAIVTTTRAEYGLLKPVIELIEKSTVLASHLIVSGTHLSKIHGNTIDTIYEDHLNIASLIDLNLEDNSRGGVCESFCLAASGFSSYLQDNHIDCVLLLGDRFEILSFAVSALLHNVPIAHIHGGEVTSGAIDDSIRHSITKLSSLHFAATSSYAKRIRQLGELPEHVYEVGGLGVDVISQVDLLSADELSVSLGIDLSRYSAKFIVTFHPETLSVDSGISLLRDLLRVLSLRSDDLLVFTMPNVDYGGDQVRDIIGSFVDAHSNAFAFESLGNQRFLSCLGVFDAVIGNSSSGILEAPTFGIATINIGSRQDGRVRAESVIDCGASIDKMRNALTRCMTSEFKCLCRRASNPYGSGGASQKIVHELECIDFSDLRVKPFVDL